MVLEEELKELKQLNEDLQQKLTSAEEKYDNAVESHSKEITESNEKVYTYLHKWNLPTLSIDLILYTICSALTWSRG